MSIENLINKIDKLDKDHLKLLCNILVETLMSIDKDSEFDYSEKLIKATESNVEKFIKGKK